MHYLSIHGVILACGATVLLLTGCTTITPIASVPEISEPRIFFTALQEGAVVGAPVQVTMAAENFVIEPAGEAHEGHGHLHIIVDAPCVDPGQGIPKDDIHLHFGQGQLDAELPLTAGEHALCLQAADGNHVALAGAGMADVIHIVVE